MTISSQNNSNITQDELTNLIFSQLYSLSNMIDHLTREIEGLTGLSKNQALTLKMISQSPEVKVSALARSMNINPATMVRILDKLEKQGLISRTRSKEDRREVEISLSDKAKVTEQIMIKTTRDVLSHYWGATKDHNLIKILKALHKVSLQTDITDVHPHHH